MGKLKILAALFVCLLLMASLAGCGGGGGATTATAPDAPAANAGGGIPAINSGGTPPAESTVPTVPTGSVTLAWDAPTDANGRLAAVSGYKVYYGTAPGNYTNAVKVEAATTYTVSGLAPGTYYFNVTDYDASGNESGFANEVSKTIP